MADAPGDDTAILILRLMPAEIGESILSRLGTEEAARLRARLSVPAPAPSPPNEIDAALAHFFDLQRIIERAPPQTAPAEEPKPTEPPAPVEEIRALPPETLARALEGEQIGTITLILSCLDPAAAGQVIQRMPVDLRADIAVRLAKPATKNPVLIDQLMKAVAEKGRRLRELPREPNQDELITNLADMLRAMPRTERLPVVKKIETADPELAVKILEKLYRIEDLLRIPDRQMQVLLGKLDVKTLATALKGAKPELMDKITANMSTRSREVLKDETELLGSVPASRVREAQTKVIAVVRKAEEDGEVTMDE